MRTAAIRHELLNSTDEDLQRRRKVVALSAAGLCDFAFISLYQSGVIKRLPELPFKSFDSNKVNAAVDAYKMGAPDATISAWIYATNMILATVEGTESSGRKPVYDVLLGGTVAANTGGALYYLYDMVFKQKKVCPYCIVGMVVNLSTAVIIAPVVLKSLKKLLSNNKRLVD